MLQILPFLTWLALLTSAGLLVALWSLGELRRRSAGLLGIWFLAGAYGQFFGGTPIVHAAGLCLQTALAVYLLLRWRLTA